MAKGNLILDMGTEVGADISLESHFEVTSLETCHLFVLICVVVISAELLIVDSCSDS